MVDFVDSKLSGARTTLSPIKAPLSTGLPGLPLLVLQPLAPLLTLSSPLPPFLWPSPFLLLLVPPMRALQEERVLVVYDKPWLEERTVKSDTVTQCT